MKRYQMFLLGLLICACNNMMAEEGDEVLVEKQALLEAKSFLEHQLIGISADELSARAKTVIAWIASQLQRDVTKRELIEFFKELLSALNDVPDARRQEIWTQLATIFPRYIEQIEHVEKKSEDIHAAERDAILEKLTRYPGEKMQAIHKRLKEAAHLGHDGFYRNIDDLLSQTDLPADIEAFVFRLKQGNSIISEKI